MTSCSAHGPCQRPWQGRGECAAWEESGIPGHRTGWYARTRLHRLLSVAQPFGARFAQQTASCGGAAHTTSLIVRRNFSLIRSTRAVHNPQQPTHDARAHTRTHLLLQPSPPPFSPSHTPCTSTRGREVQSAHILCAHLARVVKTEFVGCLRFGGVGEADCQGVRRGGGWVSRTEMPCSQVQPSALVVTYMPALQDFRIQPFPHRDI